LLGGDIFENISKNRLERGDKPHFKGFFILYIH